VVELLLAVLNSLVQVVFIAVLEVLVYVFDQVECDLHAVQCE